MRGGFGHLGIGGGLGEHEGDNVVQSLLAGLVGRMAQEVIVELNACTLMGCIVLWFPGYLLFRVATRVARFTRLDSHKRAQVLAQGFLGMCVLFTLIQAISWMNEHMYEPDRQAIDRVYSQWHLALHCGRYEDAYEHMSPDYRRAYSLQRFEQEFQDKSQVWLTLNPRRALSLSGNTAKLFPPGYTEFLNAGPEYELVKIGGEWFLTGELTWFVD